MRTSVVIATYGDDRWAQLAKRAFRSASGQGAVEVIAYHEQGGSLTGVRNTAAAGATGDWLCFLDADDELARGYVDRMREAAPGVTASSLHTSGEASGEGNEPDTGAALLVPAIQYVYPTGKVSRPEIPNGAGRRPMLEINHCCIGTLVPRQLFLDVGGFDNQWSCLEDYELFCRMIANGARIAHVPQAVYRAHVDPARTPRYRTQQSVREHRLIRQRYHHIAALREPVDRVVRAR